MMIKNDKKRIVVCIGGLKNIAPACCSEFVSRKLDEIQRDRRVDQRFSLCPFLNSTQNKSRLCDPVPPSPRSPTTFVGKR